MVKKHWIVGSAGDTEGTVYTSLDDAIVGAKRRADRKTKSGHDNQMYVYEAMQAAVAPTPPIEMQVL